MNTNKDRTQESLNDVMDDTGNLLAATANAAEENVIAARNRLSSALAAAKEACVNAQTKAIEGAKAADRVIRENPYPAIGVAFGVGALIGFLLRRRD